MLNVDLMQKEKKADMLKGGSDVLLQRSVGRVKTSRRSQQTALSGGWERLLLTFVAVVLE